MGPLGRRYFLKKVVSSCSKYEITFRFRKTLENTYEGFQFSGVTVLQPATSLKIESFIDKKQRFQRRFTKICRILSIHLISVDGYSDSNNWILN